MKATKYYTFKIFLNSTHCSGQCAEWKNHGLWSQTDLYAIIYKVWTLGKLLNCFKYAATFKSEDDYFCFVCGEELIVYVKLPSIELADNQWMFIFYSPSISSLPSSICILTNPSFLLSIWRFAGFTEMVGVLCGFTSLFIKWMTFRKQFCASFVLVVNVPDHCNVHNWLDLLAVAGWHI